MKENFPYSLQVADEVQDFVAPPLSCDAHLHVFGPLAQYPYGSENLRYEPPRTLMPDYLPLATRLGLQRFVLVQPSCYGYDNSCQLDAVAELGLDRARAVVDIDEDATDAHLEDLHARGARGVRINVNPIAPPNPGMSEKLLPRVRKIEDRCRALGWNLDFLFPDWLTAEFIPYFRQLSVPFTVGHIGMNRGRNGADAPAFQALLDTLRHHENAWIKLTAAYRNTDTADYLDLVPLAQEVIDIAPDRVIWGSDFPHVSFTQHSTVALFNLLARYAPDAAIRQQILVDNPSRLYGF